LTNTPNGPAYVTSSDAVHIALHELGGPDDATTPVLLFSHATGLCGRVWQPMASHLVARHRCVALDLRGHGHSRLPEGGASLVWSALADDVEAALDEIGRAGAPIHGIGHSMGGAALALAASRRPHAFQSLWLYEPVIVPPGGFTSADGPNPMADGAARRRERFGSWQEAYDNFAAKEPLCQLHPDALRSYVDGGFSVEPDGAVVLRCHPTTEAEVFRQALGSGAWDVVAQLELRVAIVAGRPAPFGPVEFAGTVAHALPNGTLVERRHLGHFGPLEDPSEMAQDVAEWVAAHPPT
jgi:pimeloyl-ACP methyl ester carboxylesterase